MDKTLSIQPRQDIADGISALQELRLIIRTRKDKLVINNRQYLYFSDWQLLGRFFGITPAVTETQEIIKEIPTDDGKWVMKETIGFKAKARALRDGVEISAAEAICMMDEQNWKGKPRFQVLSMAETRACAKVLRNCLQWVVRLPESEFSPDTSVEEGPVDL